MVGTQLQASGELPERGLPSARLSQGRGDQPQWGQLWLWLEHPSENPNSRRWWAWKMAGNQGSAPMHGPLLCKRAAL